jgi:hypothetical protein
MTTMSTFFFVDEEALLSSDPLSTSLERIDNGGKILNGIRIALQIIL